jgi:hypothetical protein
VIEIFPRNCSSIIDPGFLKLKFAKNIPHENIIIVNQEKQNLGRVARSEQKRKTRTNV